ncbi:MAG: tetratricopeptide repeat protein [Candidatus Omnitrophota bacterium]|nr:tetratricopeptide repeat protein [Candidatus Omnitrophota bacterium]MDZ4242451.1 tetratricopeptide repeat protein [Candidatus Omnitrophota bacterium]
MSAKSSLGIFLIFSLVFFSQNIASALLSEHPVDLYDKGLSILQSYRGDPKTLTEAKSVFARLIQKYPDSPFGYIGMSRYHMVDAYLYGNRYDMMKVRYDVLPLAVKALEMGPSVRAVHEHYALIEKIYTRFTEDQKHAQEILVLFPEKAETYYVIGTFLADQNENEKAMEFYKTGLEMKPSDSLKAKILNRMAFIQLKKMDSPGKAADLYEQVLTLRNGSPVVKGFLGMAYLKMKEYEKAEACLASALSLTESGVWQEALLQARGFLAAQHGDLAKAIQSLEEALQSRQDDFALHFKLGNLYYERGDFEGAYRHFANVIDLEPKYSGAYYFAGRSADSLGKAEVASDHFKKYLQLNSNGEEAEWIRKNVPEFSGNKN